MPLSYEGLTIPQATAIQKELRQELDLAGMLINDIKIIGGADISLNLYSTTIYAGIVLLTFPGLIPLACSLVKSETRFPYVPGYLAFREVPALVNAWEQLEIRPDILVIDGHGIAHPRRMGIAAHFGTVTRQPSMGCAKKMLFGKYEQPGMDKGSYSPISDKDQTIGYAVRSKKNTAPVFVSPGYRLSLDNSLALITQCFGKYRIPEPTRWAHEVVNRFRKGELPPGYQNL